MGMAIRSLIPPFVQGEPARADFTVAGLSAERVPGVVVLAVLLALPISADAQASHPVVPVVGVSVGFTELPEPLVETCGGNTSTFPTVEPGAGLQKGPWKLEGRAAAFTAVTVNDCGTLGIRHASGTHTDRVHPFERGHGDRSITALLRYAPLDNHWDVGVGAGRILRADVPFLVGSFALRSRGRVSFFLETRTHMMRVPYDLVTAEWAQFALTREIAREPGHEWHVSHAIRMGADLSVRGSGR